MGDHSKEGFYYEKAIALGYGTEHIYYNLAMAYGELTELEKSTGAFRKALEINPVSSDSHFGLAMAYYHRGFQDKLAEEELLKVIDIDPTYLDADYI
jgi:tetratricopeptide (TPR) repeat protein